MPDFWGKLPILRGLSPLRKGVIEAVSRLLAMSVLFGVVLHMSSIQPTAEALRAASQICATLLVAFALEVSWLVKASRRRSLDEREGRLGAFTIVGAAAALSIALSLALADRAQAGHWTLLDDLGAGWVIASLVLLGAMVVMQPWVTHVWIDEDDAS